MKHEEICKKAFKNNDFNSFELNYKVLLYQDSSKITTEFKILQLLIYLKSFKMEEFLDEIYKTTEKELAIKEINFVIELGMAMKQNLFYEALEILEKNKFKKFATVCEHIKSKIIEKIEDLIKNGPVSKPPMKISDETENIQNIKDCLETVVKLSKEF